MAVLVKTQQGNFDLTRYVTSNIPESASITDFLGTIAEQRNYTLSDPYGEVSPFIATGFFSRASWSLATIEETDQFGNLIYRGQITDISQSDDGNGPTLTLQTRDPIGVILQFGLQLFDIETCAGWVGAAEAGASTITVSGGANSIPKGAVISFNDEYAPSYLVTNNSSNVLTVDRPFEELVSGTLRVQLPLLLTGAAVLKRAFETVGYSDILDASFDNLDEADKAFNRTLYINIRNESNITLGQFIQQVQELCALDVVVQKGQISVKRGITGLPRQKITSKELMTPLGGPALDRSLLVIGYDSFYAVPSVSIDGVPTWGEVKIARGDVPNELVLRYLGQNYWQPITNGSPQLKDHTILYNNQSTARYFGDLRLQRYGQPRKIYRGRLKPYISGRPEKRYSVSLLKEFDLELDSEEIVSVRSYSYNELDYQYEIELEVTDESSFEIPEPFEATDMIGDIKWTFSRSEISSVNPWLPFTTPSGTLTTANYTQEFIDYLRARKAEYYEGTTWTSEFAVTDWDVSSNVGTITLDDEDPENNLIAGVHEMYMKYGDYDLLPVVTVPAIGNIPAGDYQITGYNVTNRTLTFAVTASDGSGSVTSTCELYTNRIAGSSTTAKWIQSVGNGSILPGDELIGGFSVRDRFQGFQIGGNIASTNFYGFFLGSSSVRSDFSATPQERVAAWNETTQGISEKITAISDGQHGTPRIGDITRQNSDVEYKYLYTGGYTP